MRSSRLVVVLVLLGCGTSAPPPAHVDQPEPVASAPAPAASSAASAPTAQPPTPSAAPVDAPHAAAAEDHFTGRITAITFHCEVDGSCNVTVDGKKTVDFGHDTRGEPPAEWGSAEQLFALHRAQSSLVGRRVEVFAATDDHERYTLRGNRAYYVHLLRR